jgi:phospholipase/carboxylesterase
VLPLALGLAACNWLRAAGYRVEWKEYPMQHQVCLPEILDIAAWLRARLL